MEYDVLIIGAGAAGLSCALVLGSGLEKPYAEDRKVGIVMHQKASHLNSALFKNALGISPGTTGKEILATGAAQLAETYPKVDQIQKEKVMEVRILDSRGFEVVTNKNVYIASRVVIAVGYTNTFRIKGLEEFVIPHQKAKVSKERIQLKNKDHQVVPGLYVAGSLAGWRSQFAIACGSGASVATDILTDWSGDHAQVHDKVK